MDAEAEPLSLSVLSNDQQTHRSTSPLAPHSPEPGTSTPLDSKDIMSRNKNEVSFEETVSLLDQRSKSPPSGVNVSAKEIDNSNCYVNSSGISNDSSSISASDEPSANFRSLHSYNSKNHNNNNHHNMNGKQNGNKKPYERPPDGGWGWVVVFASFMINLICDGISLSIGVIFVELVDYFGESKSKTAWVGSLFLSFPLITGPIASALTDHFGCRKVAIVGSLLSALGFFLGQFSTRLEHLFVFFSISGIGLALCYVTSIVSVAYYFEKRRSLATGLSVCGSGIGTFMFAPFIIFLLEKYHWRGTLLILSAIFLNIICFGLLIRDLNIDTSGSDVSEDSTSDIESNTIDSSSDSLNSLDDGNNNCDSPLPSSKPINSRIRQVSECEPANEPKPLSSISLINIPTFIKDSNNQKSTKENQEFTFRNGGYLHNLICYYPHLLSLFLPWNIDSNDLTVRTVANCPVGCINEESKLRKTVDFEARPEVRDEGLQCQHEHNHHHHHHHHHQKKVGQLLSLRPTIRSVPMTAHSHLDYLTPSGNCLRNLRLQRGSLTYRSAMLVINKYRLKASSAPDIYRTSMVTINESKEYTFWDNLKELMYNMCDISNFKSIRFSIFCLSNFILYACIDVPYVCLPDQAITSGAFNKEGASLLISILGVSNTLGVIFVGYIGDKPWLDTSFLYALFISFNGISLAAIPLTTNHLIISSLAAVYGFTISANYSLVSVILVDMISLDAFTNAYGMLLLVQGIGSLVGPPFAGWLYDVYGTYEHAFYITGICSLLSGLLVLPIGLKKGCSIWNRNKKDNEPNSVLEKKPSILAKTSSLIHCCLCRDNQIPQY